jgi:hypothetical protein
MDTHDEVNRKLGLILQIDILHKALAAIERAGGDVSIADEIRQQIAVKRAQVALGR